MTHQCENLHVLSVENNQVENVKPDVTKKPLIILDHGWAWGVLFSTFMCHVIVDGIISSFGVLYVSYLEYYGKSKSTTSWIGSLQTSLIFFTGMEKLFCY